MAKKVQSKTSGKTAGDKQSSQSKKKAATPAQKNARKLAPKQASIEEAPLLDDNAHRNIIGIVCGVAAIALLLIVAWPTNAVVTSALSTGLKRLFGIGALLLPVLLLAVSVTFIAQFDSQRVPAHVMLGLALIYLSILILFALFTPGADAAGGQASMFAPSMLESRGGYIGAGIAWAGITLLGLPVSCIIAIGLIAIGLVVIGFSIGKLKDAINAHRAERELADEEEFGVLPMQAYERPKRAIRQREPVDQAAETARISKPTRRSSSQAVTAALDESERGKSSSTAETKQLTRKLGTKRRETETLSLDSAAETMALDEGNDGDFQLPDFKLLKVSKSKRRSRAFEDELADTAARLQQTMEDFGIMATVVDWIAGPTVTLFEVDLPPGVRVSRLTNLNDDIALALAAPGVRIFAPIPGTHFVGIEVPNAQRENVLLGDVLREVHGGPLSVAIGKDVEGNSIIEDLSKMPHLLIGGTTGSGKSVGINAMIMSMLMRATPDEVRFIMIDPKRVEFAPYDGITHLYVPVVTEPKEAASALAWGVAEMELRLKTYSKVGAKNIGSYNEMVRSGKIRSMLEEGSLKDRDLPQTQYIDNPMPYIVIVIDELADLMMNVGKEVEFSISRIAQLARAAGIHLIVATQRPSANVVTGLIKANITTRIAFNVASGLDSRVILDTAGAESLIGNGDLLLSKPELGKPLRVQGCYTSDEEIAAVVEAVKSQGEPEYHSEILKTNVISLGDSAPDGSGGTVSSDDPLLWEAAEIVVASGLGSTSNIQRKLKVGYSRAGRIMDMLEEKGVVGPPNGSKPRDVLVDAMELETLKAFEAADDLE